MSGDHQQNFGRETQEVRAARLHFHHKMEGAASLGFPGGGDVGGHGQL